MPYPGGGPQVPSSWLPPAELLKHPAAEQAEPGRRAGAGAEVARENSRRPAAIGCGPPGASRWNCARSLPKSARMDSGVRRAGAADSLMRGWSARSQQGSSWRGRTGIAEGQATVSGCDSSHRLSARPAVELVPPGRRGGRSPGRQVTSRRPPAGDQIAESRLARRRRSSSVWAGVGGAYR
jgi:hypothetical protein